MQCRVCDDDCAPSSCSPCPLRNQQKFKLSVADPPRRVHSVFLGAAVLGDIMKDRADYWWSRTEYEEHGAVRLMEIKEGRRSAS